MIRQVPDLVEEQASVVRYLELTGAIRPGVGEGPFTCPNSSLSNSVSVIAPISTGTMASSLRGIAGVFPGPAFPYRFRSLRD